MEELQIFLTLCGENPEKLSSELDRAENLGMSNFEIREDLLPFNILEDGRVSNDFIDYFNKIESKFDNQRIIFTTAKGVSLEDGEAYLSGLRPVLDYLVDLGNISYIDLDFSLEKAIFKRARDMVRSRDLGLIISSHNYDRIPEYEEVKRLLIGMEAEAPDIIKFAGMVRTKEDLGTLNRVSRDFKRLHRGQRLAIIGMGKEGLETRTDPVSFGSCLAYTSFGSKAAAGQLEPEACLKVLINKTLS